MYRDVQSFVVALERAGELLRVREEVDPSLVIAAAADAESKRRAPASTALSTDPEFGDRGGRALLFERVIGSDFPVLINAFGSYRRMAMAFGGPRGERGMEDVAGVIGELVKPEPPRGLGEALAKARQFAPVLKIGPKRIRGDGACQEVVRTGDDVDLTRLPILRCWPLDGDFASVGYPQATNAGVPGLGHPDISDDEWAARYRGRYITLAGIHTIHADDRNEAKPKSHNIGMYRVQLLGKDRVAMHWHMHHDGASHWRSWKKLGEPMPVAIALGGPSVLPYAATAPLPPGISELLMAGFLNGGGIRLCRAKTVPVWVPADAEMVIEGLVRTDAGYPGWDPREEGSGELGEGAVFEGPFGDHTGFYSMPDRYPLVEVSALTHRRDAIYPTTVVGLPPQEDYFLGKATERLFLPLLKVLIPDVEDYDLPMFGAFHNCAFVRIAKHYPMHARRVMHAIWGAGQMAWTKSLFVVDDSVDVHDATAVLAAATRWCRPSRDIERVNGALDILDHAAPRLASGMKFGLDCTPKVAGEEIDGEALEHDPHPLPTSEERAADVALAESIEGVLGASCTERAPGWLFVRADRGLDGTHAVETHNARLGRRVIADLLAAGATASRFIVVVGRDVDEGDHHAGLFHWLANSDLGRDAVWDRGHGCDRVAIDATPKAPVDAHAGQAVRAWPPVLSMPDDVRAVAAGVLGD
ncbi:MAG: UbiD family decarboxylase domain-containing protein [Planctomycetota bacterium]